MHQENFKILQKLSPGSSASVESRRLKRWQGLKEINSAVCVKVIDSAHC